MKKLIALIVVMLTMVIVNLSDRVSCPVCGSPYCYFTGNTQVVYGQFLMEYRCGMGHSFYVRQR
jgi:hypothetical protein